MWNQVGTGQAACGTCHLTPPPAPHVHTQVCESCHPGYTTTGVDPALHLNGAIDVTVEPARRSRVTVDLGIGNAPALPVKVLPVGLQLLLAPNTRDSLLMVSTPIIASR